MGMTNQDNIFPVIGLWARVFRRLWPWRTGWRNPKNCSAFTTAFVSLAAKMAKADGVVVPEEAAAFEKFIDVGDNELDDVRHVYRQAMQDTAGFESFADRIQSILAADKKMKRRVFECLFYVACSDGVLHPSEEEFLREVARRFRYDEHTYRAVRATFVHDPESPYVVLDLDPNSSDRAVKARYRKLVSQNHPDRLIASGAPKAVIKAATAKVAAYNAAYRQIEVERGLRQT